MAPSPMVGPSTILTETKPTTPLKTLWLVQTTAPIIGNTTLKNSASEADELV